MKLSRDWIQTGAIIAAIAVNWGTMRAEIAGVRRDIDRLYQWTAPQRTGVSLTRAGGRVDSPGTDD